MGPIREDFAGQRQLRFRVRGETLHLFKTKGESTHQVYLKVLAYAYFGDRYPLQFDPKVDGKYQPDVASIDMTGRVRLWIQCGATNVDRVSHLLRHHSQADSVVLVVEHELEAGETSEDFTELDFSAEVARYRKQIHYRYTDKKLKVLTFRALDEWFDPDDVTLDPYNYHLIEF